MKRLFYLFGCLLILLTAGCRSAKKIQKVIASNQKRDSVQTVTPSEDPKADSLKFIQTVFNKIQGNRIDYKSFSSKIKVHYQGSDGKDYDFEANLIMYKDSVIWVRVNALLGIEAFRLLITPDSVKLINDLDKVVQLRSASYLQDVIHLPLSFGTLQDLIIGNPVYLDSNIVYYKKEQSHLFLMSIGSIFKNYVTLSSDNYSVQHSKLDDIDVTRARTCEITYSDYEPLNSSFFSAYRQVSVTEKSSLDIQINFKQYSFNKQLPVPFRIPKNYKRK